jgi:hypothetical protein
MSEPVKETRSTAPAPTAPAPTADVALKAASMNEPVAAIINKSASNQYVAPGVGYTSPHSPAGLVTQSPHLTSPPPRPTSAFSPKLHANRVPKGYCEKSLFQIRLLLRKRYLELMNRKLDVFYLTFPPLLFFSLAILLYSVIPIFFKDGIEEYIIPVGFWVSSRVHAWMLSI